VFAGEGMQFASHFGHVFSLFRGLWATECVQISFYGPLRGPIFVGGRCCLAAPSRGWTAVLLRTPFNHIGMHRVAFSVDDIAPRN
jgi:hypothetical protein